MGFTIAIDGPAAAGKGTVSRAVAAHFGFAHLDTGLLYRATGRRTLDGTDPVEAARNLQAHDLEAEDLRGPMSPRPRAGWLQSPRCVRRWSISSAPSPGALGGAVLDGRDIGTVICPDAEVKLFVTASDDIRANRRWKELREKGFEDSYDDVLADLRTRDARDSARAAAPLKPADDAVTLDTSRMSIDEAIAAAIEMIEARRSA